MNRSILAAALALTWAGGAAAQSVDLNDSRVQAELLALEITGELLPSAPLADQIEADLAAIRSAYPEMASIRPFPRWMPGEALVKLRPDAFAKYEHGTFDGFEPIADALGDFTSRPFTIGTSLFVQFGEVYHGERLSELFASLSDVERAEPNFTTGDGNDIVASPDGRYTFSRGYGDCPAGCIHHEYYDFVVTGGRVIRTPEPSAAALVGALLGAGVVGGVRRRAA